MPEIGIMRKNDSKQALVKKIKEYNTANNSFANESPDSSMRKSRLPKTRMSEYQAERIKDMQIKLKAGKATLRMNATPTP